MAVKANGKDESQKAKKLKVVSCSLDFNNIIITSEMKAQSLIIFAHYKILTIKKNENQLGVKTKKGRKENCEKKTKLKIC